jgi:1-pyrroline-5-carboxylate dehydrogenase
MEVIEVVQPHRKDAVLGRLGNATAADARAAITAAKAAAPAWRRLPFEERAAIVLKAADLLAGPWRQTLNAATMLGQSKTAYQAEIDSACELIDFWRYNVAYAAQILREQPRSQAGVWNRMDYRPLEGFVLAITPFNFTAIAGNLPTAPALMGNKPAPLDLPARAEGDLRPRHRLPLPPHGLIMESDKLCVMRGPALPSRCRLTTAWGSSGRTPGILS